MPTPQAEQVEHFFEGLPKGALTADQFTPDAAVWTTSSGDNPDIARFIGGVGVLARIFRGDLRYQIDALTEQDDRVVAEVRSAGTLVNGEAYQARAVFVFRFRDGSIASVAEHMNPLLVQEKLAPLIRQAMAPPAD